jgi:hypothetical protein
MTIKRARPKSPKKTSARRTPTLKTSIGGAAVGKGRSFEDQVADLYRLLGARVTPNIEIHQKKVDILATFRIPGSSREHTVIVECKDEQRSVAANQRIMAFKGLLSVARNDGIADSAEIVTRVPWSQQFLASTDRGNQLCVKSWPETWRYPILMTQVPAGSLFY